MVVTSAVSGVVTARRNTAARHDRGPVSTRPAPQRPHLPSSAAARRRRRRRLLPPVALALVGVGLAAGAVVLLGSDDRSKVAEQYGAAYAKGDYTSMYALLSASDRRAITLERFTELQQQARTTAT